MKAHVGPNYSGLSRSLCLWVCSALQTVKVSVLVRRQAAPSGLPERFGQAFHDVVLGLVIIAVGPAERRKVCTDAGWTVDGQLLLDGDMHGHVQERIRFTQFRSPVPVGAGVWLVEQWLVFGMAQGDSDHQPLDTLQLPSCPMLLPGIEEHLAQLAPVLPEEHVRVLR